LCLRSDPWRSEATGPAGGALLIGVPPVEGAEPVARLIGCPFGSRPQAWRWQRCFRVILGPACPAISRWARRRLISAPLPADGRHPGTRNLFFFFCKCGPRGGPGTGQNSCWATRNQKQSLATTRHHHQQTNLRRVRGSNHPARVRNRRAVLNLPMFTQ